MAPPSRSRQAGFVSAPRRGVGLVNRRLPFHPKSRRRLGKTFTNSLVSSPRSGRLFRHIRLGLAKMKTFVRFVKNLSGATAIEYGLIAALIAVAVIGGVSQLGTNANKTFKTVAAKM